MKYDTYGRLSARSARAITNATRRGPGRDGGPSRRGSERVAPPVVADRTR